MVAARLRRGGPNIPYLTIPQADLGGQRRQRSAARTRVFRLRGERDDDSPHGARDRGRPALRVEIDQFQCADAVDDGLGAGTGVAPQDTHGHEPCHRLAASGRLPVGVEVVLDGDPRPLGDRDGRHGIASASCLADFAAHSGERDSGGLLRFHAPRAVRVRALSLRENGQCGGEDETDDRERGEQIGEMHGARVGRLDAAVNVRSRRRSFRLRVCPGPDTAPPVTLQWVGAGRLYST